MAAPVSAAEVVVFDRGGGGARVQAVTRAVGAAGHAVVGPDDTAALDVAYAAACADGPCLARAGVAGGVDLVVLAEADHVVVVDVASASWRRRLASDDRLGVVVLKLFEPGRWGTLALPPVPPEAVVLVDGAPWLDEDLSPGPHAVALRDHHGERTIDVVVTAGEATSVTWPAPAPGPPPSAPSVGFIVGGVGLGVGVVGLATGLIGEAVFASVPLDPVPDADAARTLVTAGSIATIGWGVAVAGSAAAIAGAALLLMEDGGTTPGT
jgi:hypothetical protein